MKQQPFRSERAEPSSTAAEPSGPASASRRLAAGAAGAAEGLAQGLEEQRLERSVDQAIEQTKRLSRSVGSAVGGQVGDGRDGRMAHAAHEVERRAEVVKQKTVAAVERTREGAQAVAETSRRAVEAPPRIAEDLKEAANAWVAGMARGLGMYAAAATAGLIALIAFTIAAAVGLNIALGAPWGTVIVAGVYLVAAAVFFTMARGARERGRERAVEHLHEAREEVRSVTRPLRSISNKRQVEA